MNQKLLSSIAATALTTGLGFVASNPVIASQGSSAEADFSLASELADGEAAVVTLAFTASTIASIESHEFNGRRAATLYVRNLPLLTFLGNSDGEQSAPSGSDPAVRAMAIATRLNQLAQANADAQNINVNWAADCNCYAIDLHGEKLIELDTNVVLPDTTFDPAEDALQATNRLRRLMGNADPLPQILQPVASQPKSQVTLLPQPKTPPQQTLEEQRLFRMDGWASWYGPGFDGAYSASGEVFNQYGMTAAHRDLPFNTRVRVTNLDNGRSVVVRINDRGPFIHDRVIDLSMGAADEIGMVSSGTAPVQLEVLDYEDWSAGHQK